MFDGISTFLSIGFLIAAFAGSPWVWLFGLLWVCYITTADA